MQANKYSSTDRYVVAIGLGPQSEYYAVDLELVKNTLKQPAAKRADFIKANGEQLPSSVYACDLWIDTTIDQIEFWDIEGNSDWREFLIEENK